MGGKIASEEDFERAMRESKDKKIYLFTLAFQRADISWGEIVKRLGITFKDTRFECWMPKED